MNIDDFQFDEDDAGDELAALEMTRQVARDRWFRRFAATEQRHHNADAWALKAEARPHSRRRGSAPPARLS